MMKIVENMTIFVCFSTIFYKKFDHFLLFSSVFMQKFEQKSTSEVYAVYVGMCQLREIEPMTKGEFTRAFLRENPEYQVVVGKVREGGVRRSVRMFALRDEQRKLDFLWD